MVCCNAQAAGSDPEPGNLFDIRKYANTWVPAMAELDGGTGLVVVPRDASNQRFADDWTGVRYARQDEPQCVMYNLAGLPALPFEFNVPFKGSAIMD